MAYVYRHIRLDKNEPFYIGIAKKDTPNFERAYNCYYLHRNKIWKAIFDKTKIEVEILFENVTYEFAKGKEIEFIELYKRKCDGGTLANLTKGGDGVLGFKNPKLAERNKTGIWKGKRHTEESKLKIKLGNVGKKNSKETRKKISESRKGKYGGKNNPKYRGGIFIYINNILVKKVDLVEDAMKFSGLSRSYINNCIYGLKKGGFKGFDFKRAFKE